MLYGVLKTVKCQKASCLNWTPVGATYNITATHDLNIAYRNAQYLIQQYAADNCGCLAEVVEAQ